MDILTLFQSIPGAFWVFAGGIVSVWFTKWAETRFVAIQQKREQDAAAVAKQSDQTQARAIADSTNSVSIIAELIKERGELRDDYTALMEKWVSTSNENVRLVGQMELRDQEIVRLREQNQRLYEEIYKLNGGPSGPRIEAKDESL